MAILFAISLVVLVFASGVAIDGGFGLFQYRQAQNAADFAAQGGAQAMVSNCDAGSSPAPLTGSQLVAVIDDFVNHNSPNSAVPVTNTAKNWTAYYLDSLGKPFYIGGSDAVTPSGSIIPAGACGVHVTVTPEWPPFIAQIMGFTHLQTAAGAAAVNSVGYQGAATSIVALGQNGAHTILEAGNGKFNVTGTIFDNANGWLNSSQAVWSNGDCTPTRCADVIDGKQNGTMNVTGNLDSVAPVPFDWCFGGDGGSSDPSGPPNAGVPSGESETSTPPPAPWNTAKCTANNTNISYWNWYPNQTEYTIDPIANDPQAPSQPTTSDAYCPGLPVQTFDAASGSPTKSVYTPGVYTYPVVVAATASFENCSQVLGQPNTGTVYEGLYVFEKGLVIRPPAGDTVSGNALTFYTQGIPNKIGGVQNAGDGEPVLSAAVNSASCGSGSDNCNVDSSCGTVCNQPNPVANQGLNDSVEIGGKGTVNLSAPTSGTYTDFLIWQQSQAGGGIPANIGLDALPTDAAQITLAGIIYDDTLPTGQDLSHETYWGNNSGVPYLAGGMLIAGFGLDSSTGMTTCAGGVACQVTINGLATVDEFQTQGNTDLTISGSGYQIPGIAGSGATLVA
ncbi:MAG TPA: Tad domain-containing protein [Candidatus Dormibacteraeota bacterium]|nr:Tad domain-containing protein [Candidatus Dormibacteraeota bacterium]